MNFAVIYVAVVVIIVIIALNLRRQKRRRRNIPRNIPTPQRKTRGKNIDTYRTVDPNFDIQAFSERLSNLYVQMQNDWTAGDISPLRPYFSDALFAQMERQLAQKKELHQTNYVERIAVLSASPQTWYQENGMDHIVAILQTRIIDYTLNDDTGELVSGSRTAEKFMTYEWDLARKSGTVTEKNPKMQTVNCPNCGAPVEINATAKCPYCGSIITILQNDWALTSIRGISQKTKGH